MLLLGDPLRDETARTEGNRQLGPRSHRLLSPRLSSASSKAGRVPGGAFLFDCHLTFLFFYQSHFRALVTSCARSSAHRPLRSRHCRSGYRAATRAPCWSARGPGRPISPCYRHAADGACVPHRPRPVCSLRFRPDRPSLTLPSGRFPDGLSFSTVRARFKKPRIGARSLARPPAWVRAAGPDSARSERLRCRR